MTVLGSKLAVAAAEPPQSPRRAPNLPEVLASKFLRNTVVLFSAVAFACYVFQHAHVAGSYAANVDVSVEVATKASMTAMPAAPSFKGSSPLPTVMAFASGEIAEAQEEDATDALEAQSSEDRAGHDAGDNEVAEIDWSRFAYAQYVTNTDYLCNSVMLFESLHRLESKPDRVLLYPSDMMDPEESNPKTKNSTLLVQARDKYSVKLMPILVQHRDAADKTWSESYTKLLIFNLTQYDRVLHLDSDSTILEPMDELFLLPPSPVVMPRAYWFDDDRRELFTTGLMLVQPSKTGFSRIMRTAKEARKEEYDMEIMNNIYGDTAEVLPHRPYILVSGEFRAKSHDKYLRGDDGDDEEPVEEWDATDVFNEAKFVHFSDWPVAKPWRYNSPMFKRLHEPKCGKLLHQVDCSGKEIWNWLYDDFAARRKSVCGLDLVKKKFFTPEFIPKWSKKRPGPQRGQLKPSIESWVLA